jgi:hypothetical protein
VTPEGKVKAAIKRILDPLKPRVWYDMPVPGGWGKSTLDFVGSAYGLPFAIEAKAIGGKVTPRQYATIRKMEIAGVQCFIIEPGDFLPLELWLKAARLHDRAGEVQVIAIAPGEHADAIIDEYARIDLALYQNLRKR